MQNGKCTRNIAVFLAGADVDRTADAGDRDLLTGGRILAILWFGGLQRFVPVSGCRHQRGMGLRTVDTVRLDARPALEGLHSGECFCAKAAVRTVLQQGEAQLQEQLLQGLDVRALRTLLQRTGTEGVLGRGRIRRVHGCALEGVAVVDERQRIPVRPRTFADLRPRVCF